MNNSGTYSYPDGSTYNGLWNSQNQRDGYGHMKFKDGSQYWGNFERGLCSGPGIMLFKDDSKYEGDFQGGKFNGYGIFTRFDKMKFEGQFKEGKIEGLGLITFSNMTNGLPRNEGYFNGNQITRREKCGHVIEKSVEAANRARSLRG